MIALGSAALFTFGMYKVISANRLRRFARAHSRNGNACCRAPSADLCATRSWFREEKDIRLAILPFLTAESDLQCADAPRAV